MNTNGQIRYKELVGHSLQLTDHFRKRYKERVSKGSTHASEFAKDAYLFGRDIDAVKDKGKREYLQHKLRDGKICKIYRGFIFIFKLNRAITVFPIPNIKPLK